MSKVSDNGIKTSVHLLINTVAVVSLVLLPATSWGQAAAAAVSNNNQLQQAPAVNADTAQAISAGIAQGNQVTTWGNKCDKLEADYNKQIDAIGKSCTDSGIKDCLKMINACQSSSSSSTDDTPSTTTTTPSVPANQCPQLSGKTYADLEKDLDKAEQDSQDLQKSIQDATDDMAKTKQDGQSKINDAQSQLKQAALDTASQNQQRLTAFTQTQAQANQQIQNLQAGVLAKQQDIASKAQVEAAQLLQYSPASSQSACTVKMNTAKTDGTCTAASSTNYITNGTQRRDCLINVYDSCMTSLSQMSAAAVTAFNQAQQQDNLAINQLQAQITDQNTIVKNQQIQMQTDNQNADIALNNKQQDIAKLQQQITDQINQSVQKMMALSQSNQQRQADINKRISDIKQQMAEGVGTNSGSTVSASTASRDIRSAISKASADLTEGLKTMSPNITATTYQQAVPPQACDWAVTKVTSDSKLDKVYTTAVGANGTLNSSNSSALINALTNKSKANRNDDAPPPLQNYIENQGTGSSNSSQ